MILWRTYCDGMTVTCMQPMHGHACLTFQTAQLKGRGPSQGRARKGGLPGKDDDEGEAEDGGDEDGLLRQGTRKQQQRMTMTMAHHVYLSKQRGQCAFCSGSGPTRSLTHWGEWMCRYTLVIGMLGSWYLMICEENESWLQVAHRVKLSYTVVLRAWKGSRLSSRGIRLTHSALSSAPSPAPSAPTFPSPPLLLFQWLRLIFSRRASKTPPWHLSILLAMRKAQPTF